MPSLGISELMLIGIVLLVVVGPERLPHATRWLGRAYATLRRSADDLRRALVLEADRMDEEGRLKELRRRREEAEVRQAEAEAQVGEGAQAQPEHLPPAEEEPEEPEAEELPQGFTREEWDELPAHIREIVRKRRSS